MSKHKAKVKAWGLFSRRDEIRGVYTTRSRAREVAENVGETALNRYGLFVFVPCRVRPIRITVLKGKG